MASRVKDGVLGGDHAAIKMGGRMSNLHKFSHALLKIAAPHIGELEVGAEPRVFVVKSLFSTCLEMMQKIEVTSLQK